MDLILIIGLTGAALILAAFILNQLHVWKEDYFIYDFVNFIGSYILAMYGLLIAAYPFVVLNLIWAVLSARDVFIDLRRNEKKWGWRKGFYRRWMK